MFAATLIIPVAAFKVTFGEPELVDVIVTSAGFKTIPLMVSDARTEGVDPPISPSIAANVSGTA